MFLGEIRVKNVFSLCIYKASILITCALFRFSKYGFINIIFEVLKGFPKYSTTFF